MIRPEINQLYVLIDMFKKSTSLDTKCLAEAADYELNNLKIYMASLESKLYRIQEALKDEVRT